MRTVLVKMGGPAARAHEPDESSVLTGEGRRAVGPGDVNTVWMHGLCGVRAVCPESCGCKCLCHVHEQGRLWSPERQLAVEGACRGRPRCWGSPRARNGVVGWVAWPVHCGVNRARYRQGGGIVCRK